jgi:DNA-binding protein HU-beta
MEPLNKQDLVRQISEATGISQRQSTICINSLIDIVRETLTTGRPVKLVGFAHFDTIVRPARKARNPQTNAVVDVPATRVVIFRAGKQLKQSVKHYQADVAA